MTEQERQPIESLASRLRNSPAPEINPEAGTLIRRTIGANPSALYILTQTILLEEIALNQVKAQTPPPSFPGEAFLGRLGKLEILVGMAGRNRVSASGANTLAVATKAARRKRV